MKAQQEETLRLQAEAEKEQLIAAAIVDDAAETKAIADLKASFDAQIAAVRTEAAEEETKLQTQL